MIHAANGRYDDHLTHARSALVTLDNCSTPDVFQEAFAIANLAHLVRDFDLPNDAKWLISRVDSVAWSSEVSRSKFRTVKPLGWCPALQGDNFSALRWFRIATETASCSPERIKTAVGRALIARELGPTAMLSEELDFANGLADSFDWNNTVDDLRSVLLDLAQIASTVTPARARGYLDRYTTIRRGMDMTVAARLEDRVRAEESHTHGLVLRAEGRLAESTDRLTTAFWTWEQINYQWRAGGAALELAELNVGDVFRLAVRRELKRRPDSLFSSRARLVA